MRVLDRVRESRLARDTGHLATGQGLRLVIQAAYFVLIARILGPGKYGAFVAIVSLASILAPFSGMGTTHLFVKNVSSGKRPARVCWGNGLVATVVSGTAFSALALTISYLLHLRVPFSAVVAVCISDLFLLRVI